MEHLPDLCFCVCSPLAIMLGPLHLEMRDALLACVAQTVLVGVHVLEDDRHGEGEAESIDPKRGGEASEVSAQRSAARSRSRTRTRENENGDENENENENGNGNGNGNENENENENDRNFTLRTGEIPLTLGHRWPGTSVRLWPDQSWRP